MIISPTSRAPLGAAGTKCAASAPRPCRAECSASRRHEESTQAARSMSSTRYSSGSRTKHRREPPSRTVYGGRSGSMPCPFELFERAVEIVDADRDVAVAGAERRRCGRRGCTSARARSRCRPGRRSSSSPPARRRGRCPSSPAKREPERLVERAALLRVGDPHHGVEEGVMPAILGRFAHSATAAAAGDLGGVAAAAADPAHRVAGAEIVDPGAFEGADRHRRRTAANVSTWATMPP